MLVFIEVYYGNKNPREGKTSVYILLAMSVFVVYYPSYAPVYYVSWGIP